MRGDRTASGLGAVALLAFLAACSVGPDFKRPDAPAAPGYGSAQPGAMTASAGGDGGEVQRFVAGQDIPGQWWTLFQSPKLSALVDEALKVNPSITAAEAALRQSRELYLAQRGGYYPTIQAGFSAQRANNADATIANPTVSPSSTYSLYTPQLSLSYAPDVFGATARSVEAAQSQVASSRFQLQAAYVTLSSNVVVTAIQEASLRGQIVATERLLQLLGDVTETVRKRRAIGTATQIDLLTQESAEAQTAATLPPLQRQLGQARDALTALLGRLPSEEPVDTFALEDLTLPADLPLSLPSRLVAQRPDVRQAEENLHMASAQVGIAMTNLLPQFSIDASAGSSAFQLGQLFSANTNFWSLGASLSQTLFDGGSLRHRRRAADAALDQAAAQYRSAVILACQNVADTLRALQADAQAFQASAKAERAAKDALELAKGQYQLGAVSLLVVMNAEQAYRQGELALIQARANRYADTAGLFQSLGGGWWNRSGETLDGTTRSAN